MTFFRGWVPGNLFNGFTESRKIWIEMPVGSHFGGSKYQETCWEPQEKREKYFLKVFSVARCFYYIAVVKKDQTKAMYPSKPKLILPIIFILLDAI